MTKEHLRHVAIHEAAHAVAAAAHRCRFEYVTAIPAELGNGLTSGGHLKSKPFVTKIDTPASLNGRLVSILVGPAASEVHPHFDPTTYNGDIAEAEELIRCIHPDAADSVRDAHFSDIVALAKDFVRRNWRAIEAVAAALIERGTLTEKQVRAVIRAERIEVAA